MDPFRIPGERPPYQGEEPASSAQGKHPPDVEKLWFTCSRPYGLFARCACAVAAIALTLVAPVVLELRLVVAVFAFSVLTISAYELSGVARRCGIDGPTIVVSRFLGRPRTLAVETALIWRMASIESKAVICLGKAGGRSFRAVVAIDDVAALSNGLRARGASHDVVGCLAAASFATRDSLRRAWALPGVWYGSVAVGLPAIAHKSIVVASIFGAAMFLLFGVSSIALLRRGTRCVLVYERVFVVVCGVDNVATFIPIPDMTSIIEAGSGRDRYFLAQTANHGEVKFSLDGGAGTKEQEDALRAAVLGAKAKLSCGHKRTRRKREPGRR